MDMGAQRVVEFYFDPVSPYAWLASTQLDRVATMAGMSVKAVPVLLAVLLDHFGNQGPAEIPVKRSYAIRDAMRRAKRYRVSFEGPPTHPFNPLLALRCATAIRDDGQQWAFTKTMLRSAWEQGLDVTVAAILESIASQCGLDGAKLLTDANDATNKAALAQSTAHAIELGIFGVPTLRVDGENFWGEDRLDDLLVWLEGGLRVDEDVYRRVLERPASAQRKRV